MWSGVEINLKRRGRKPVLDSDEYDTGSDTDVTESEYEEEDYTEKFNRYVKFGPGKAR